MLSLKLFGFIGQVRFTDGENIEQTCHKPEGGDYHYNNSELPDWITDHSKTDEGYCQNEHIRNEGETIPQGYESVSSLSAEGE